MEIGEVARALRHFWWVVLAVPIVTGIGLVLLSIGTPYQSTVRATVLIPGDTESTGNAERPELMVLDDLPILIESRVFAEAAAQRTSDLPVETVQAALSASRYSRVLTIHATGSTSTEAQEIAAAAEDALPDAVNRYLIANGGQPATVNVIEPATEPTRDRPNSRPLFLTKLLVAAAFGAFLAVICDLVARSRGPEQEGSNPAPASG